PLADDLLTLLLESAAAVHSAESEPVLTNLVMDIATRGTGLPNAAMLRPLDAAGRIEVMGTRSPSAREPIRQFSRSLLAAAGAGNVAELSANSEQGITESIVQMQINAAICVPLMVGGAAAAF